MEWLGNISLKLLKSSLSLSTLSIKLISLSWLRYNGIAPNPNPNTKIFVFFVCCLTHSYILLKYGTLVLNVWISNDEYNALS